MEPLEIPQEEIIALDAVSTGVVGLRILFVNVFAIAADRGWVLVDAGLTGSAGRIRRWAHHHFNEPPAAIVLTHAHFDHAGALDDLLEDWHTPVYAHPLELPYLIGGREYPPPDPSVGGGAMARMASLYPRRAPQVRGRVEPIPHDGSLPVLDDWRWIHTPGHTDGHVSLFRDLDRTLIVGDAFCTTKQESFFAVATQRPELHGPPAYFTTNWDEARESVRRLAALQPEFVAPGHGQPMSGQETRKALVELSERFDELARPDQGRYVSRDWSDG
jgi:glyoxylase-like metal-dependent hydrolase (beta-lactamase superfamily II)